MPDWQDIDESSVIAAVAHDADGLHVRFKSGKEVCYEGVPAGMRQAILDSPSPGSFWHRQIRGRFAAVDRTDAGRKPGGVAEQPRTERAE